MLQLKIGIVEDEELVAEKITQLLLNLDYDILKPVSNYTDAIRMLERYKPDLMILDIGLGVRRNEGIRLADKIKKDYNIPFIFLTTIDDKANINFAKLTNPSAFLVKPFSKSELSNTIKCALENHIPSIGYVNIPFLFLKNGDRFFKVSEMEIMYIQSNHIYLNIYTTTKKFLLRSTVDDFLKQLSAERFMKIGRSYIINIYFVNSFNNESVEIDGTFLKLSSFYRHLFYEKINKTIMPKL